MRNLLSMSVVCCTALACVAQPTGETTSEPVVQGTADFALTTNDYKLVGSFDVLMDGTDSKAILEASEDAGVSQTLTLPIGSYELDLIGADYDDLLPAYTVDQGGSTSNPYCVYTGPNGATLGPLSGCTVVRYNPDPFVVRAHDNTEVIIEVTFHFEEDVTVYFSSGSARFHLDPEDEQYCGFTGVVCAANEVCTIFDDAAPPACVRMCAIDAECEVGESCILTDLMGGDGTGATAQGLCR